MTLHREGTTIILGSLITYLILSALNGIYIFPFSNILAYLIYTFLIVMLVLIIQFFRIPKRKNTYKTNEITCPADGKVVVIEETTETEYFKDMRIQVSIFMSPINVHVTRYAMSGDVKYSKYHPGKYLVAWHPKASTENERTSVVLHNKVFGDVLYRQIAGALAKRIVNYAKVGDTSVQGADAGFIKFGSRVDLFLPLGTDLKVSLGDKVKGGVQLIAEK
mgnify:CR=1 FL=1